MRLRAGVTDRDMQTHEFAVVASGIDQNVENFEDIFFAAGCDDATISFQRGVTILDFAREAKSFSHALITAVRDVMNAGAKVERIEPDSLVSLSEIAKRTGLSRAAISHYALGHRSEGFPFPVARVMTESPLWDWVQVARWIRKGQKADVDVDAVVKARVVKDCNHVLAEAREWPRPALGKKRLAIVA